MATKIKKRLQTAAPSEAPIVEQAPEPAYKPRAGEWDLLSKIMQYEHEGALQEILGRKITPEMFLNKKARKAFEFILQHHEKYKRVPSIDTFGKHVKLGPHDRVNRTVDEPTSYFIDGFYRQSLLGKAKDWLLQAAGEIGDDPEKAMLKLSERVRDYMSQASATREKTRPLKFSDVLRLPPPTQIIEGFLAANCFASIAGPPGEGKSFLLSDIALHLATGRPKWHGHNIAPGPHRVCYIAAEGAGEYSVRFAAWQERYKLKEAPDDTFILWPAPVSLVKPDSAAVAVLVEAIRAFAPTVIIIDTWFRSITGADASSDKDMGIAVENVEQLRRAFNDCLVIAVHHCPKQNKKSFFGSQNFSAGIRWGAFVEQDHETQQITVSWGKSNNFKKFEDLMFHLEDCGPSAVLVRDTAAEGQKQAKLTKLQWAALAALYRAREPLPHGIWWGASGIKASSTFNAVLAELVKRKLVGHNGKKGTHSPYAITDEGRAIIAGGEVTPNSTPLRHPNDIHIYA